MVYILYVLLPHHKQNRMLLLASYVFYSAWDWRFLSLIFISTVVDYHTAHAIEKNNQATKRRLYLLLSISTNLGLLGFFKYYGFFSESLAHLFFMFGVQIDNVTLNIVLPVGISFYTFQTMSYTIDIYNRKLKPADNFLDFALFVAFFPQLVAGPIERAKNLLPQIYNSRNLTLDQTFRGIYLILWGLFKKVVIADGLATAVNTVYNTPGTVSSVDVLLATVYFSLQIYCDFSGYSDIARGVSKLLGFELIINFKVPYFSDSPSEFWRRWHISLSEWLRDYLYIPIGGNRHGVFKTFRNLMLTMTLGGLWHGAAWNFIFWGIYHGLLLSFYRIIASLFKKSVQANFNFFKLMLPVRVLVFFTFTCFGWLLFRANSIEQILSFTNKLIFFEGFQTIIIPQPPFATIIGLIFLIFLDFFEYLTGNDKFYNRFYPPIRGYLYASIVFVLIMGMSNAPEKFIYFAF